MNGIVEILKFFLPALAIGAAAYLIVLKWLEHDGKRQTPENEKTAREMIVPARMQAYERIILFLERITPEHLLRRVIRTGMSSRLLQSELVATVRNEYEHNLSQQVYMSAAAWQLTKTAAEETIRLINVCGSKTGASATASDLAQMILEITSRAGKFPTEVAIDGVKKEFASQFFSTAANP